MAQTCCNPFDIPGHIWSSRSKNLRPVTAWMCERAPQVIIGSKICDTCRKKLSNEPPAPVSKKDSSSSETAESQKPQVYVHTPEAVASLNMCLADIGETPYSHSKCCGKSTLEKVKKITKAMKCTLIGEETINDGSEMLQQLKEKFQSTAQRGEQLQILTVLLKSWPLTKIQQQFGVLNYGLKS